MKSTILFVLMQWISSVLRRGVQKLHFYIREHVFVSSHSLFCCNSLVELKIQAPCTLRVPGSHFVPNLKIIILHEVKFLNDSFPHSEELFLSFPVLKAFECINCTWLNAQYVSIETPQLESFGIEYLNTSLFHCTSKFRICSLHLTKFSYAGYLSENIILLEPSSILVASILIPCLKACMLLAQLCKVEGLHLQLYMIQAHKRGRHFASLPTFEKLIYLELDSYFQL
ncbi:F-box/FBD/LRR-repeat protein [Quillaja saponaria]|uniref:F-box/FBD/LRR-repeat protein n=1 Tax=Quillaja saponaria TaxID=32244 RepID=A0AAD7L1H8_QUISA|nr:F-box/FBD/LRR-repeat protein [Quillaja saponaria]